MESNVEATTPGGGKYKTVEEVLGKPRPKEEAWEEKIEMALDQLHDELERVKRIMATFIKNKGLEENIKPAKEPAAVQEVASLTTSEVSDD